MLKKKSLKYSFQQVLMKKVFVKNFYEKFFVRHTTIENGNLFYNNEKNVQTGFSYYPVKFIFTHLYQERFTFISLLNKKKSQPRDFIFFFYKSLKSLELKKTKNLLFLKIVQGGCKCYFSGLLGFMPIKHVLALTKKIRIKRIKIKFNLLTINFFLSKNIFKKEKILRFSFSKITIKQKMRPRKSKFSLTKKLYLRYRFNKYIFLLTPYINKFKTYEAFNNKKKYKKKKL